LVEWPPLAADLRARRLAGFLERQGRHLGSEELRAGVARDDAVDVEP
jgi:hypothetical protein